MHIRLLVLSWLIPILAVAQNGSTKSSIQRAADKLKNDPTLANASITFLAEDLNTKEHLGELSPNMSLVPASTMKVITTASAYQILGPNYRFKTRVQYTGEIDSTGTLKGDIYIKGGGDPALGSKYFKSHYGDFMATWVKAIKKLGIKEVDGRVIGDAGAFKENVVPGSWTWSDIGNYYGAPATGLSIYDNFCTLYFSSGPRAGDSTQIDSIVPKVPEMYFMNSVVAANSNRDNAYVYGAPYDGYRIVEGSIPKGRSGFGVKATIHDPAYLAAFQLEQRLEENGVEITGGPSTVRRMKLLGDVEVEDDARNTITTTESPTVASIAYWVNKVSVNLFAEHFISGISMVRTGQGNTFSGTSICKSYWQAKGVDMTGFYMNDGSGLSRSNAVSAKQIVSILEFMSGSDHAESYKSTFAVAGQSGTLSSIGRGTFAEGNLMGKSGSMTRIRSYAGYVKTRGGRKVAFAVVVNNFNCTGYQMKLKLAQLMVDMANSTD